MNSGIISLFSNDTQLSADVRSVLIQKLMKRGYTVMSEFSEDAGLIMCIGGDGAFLETIHACNFTEIPVVGINTGHLGFFQEILPEDFDSFMEDYEKGHYKLQKLNTVMCEVTTAGGTINNHTGLNEITITGRKSYSVHFDISIDGKLVEKFSGDGVLVATSSGSTAYNYSLGGSIVDPRIDLLQLTPLAPMNTTAYRSFTSSLMLPADLTIGIVPENSENTIFINSDGIETGYHNVSKINVTASEKSVNLVRVRDYDFWNKVKEKFL